MKKPKRFYPEEFELKEDRRRAPVITEEIKEIRERAPIIEDRDPEEFEYNLKMKKGGMTKAQKKVGSVMKEFKAGKLHSGKKGPVVKNPKQAIAIALSESGQSKKKMMGGMMSDGVSKKGSGIEMKSKGGMVRGQGAAIRGTKFKGIF
jgi:hypothetical protein